MLTLLLFLLAQISINASISGGGGDASGGQRTQVGGVQNGEQLAGIRQSDMARANTSM